MACDTYLRSKTQTLAERKEEVRTVVDEVARKLAARLVKVRVGPQGAVAFDGLTDEERAGVTDACIYRRIMVSGSALARAQIARAEQLAGVSVDKKVLAGGAHSHDGGRTWNGGHK
jgi:hypothetical protein